MNESMLAEMLEATRLTQSGRLQEAAAMIQRALQGAGHTGPSPGPTARPSVDIPGFGAGRWQDFTLPGIQANRPSTRPAEPIPGGARFIEGSYRNPVGARSYKLYIPSHYRGQALPLVVMLHGCTQDPDDFAAGTRMNRLAEDRQCLVLYPAQAASANPQKCWNWFKQADQRREGGEAALIAGMTRQIAADYGADPRRIYVAGLSSGGAMAAVLGATHPDLFAAVGVHSGLAAGAARDLPSAFAAMRHGGPVAGPSGRCAPTIVFHGDRDTTVHPRNGEQVVAQAMLAACPAEKEKPKLSTQRGQVPGGHGYTRAVYRDTGGLVFLEHWLIHGGGHAWAGGSASGSYVDPKGPDAAEEMLRFFYQHSLAHASASTH